MGNITDVITDIKAIQSKESPANKGQIDGYAGLDSSGVVPYAQLPATASPIVTIATTVNESSTTQGSYTSVANSVVNLTAINGSIINHDTVAKTFDYNSQNILGGVDETDTITAYATLAGQLQSDNDITDMIIKYVPVVADTAVTPDGNNFTTTNITYA